MSNTNSEYNAKLPQDKKSNFAKPRQIQQDINQQHVKFQNELDTDFTDKEARLVSSQEDFPSQPQIQLQISQNPQKKSLWKRVMSDIGKIQGKIFQKLPLRILLNLRKSKLQKSLSKQKSTLQHQSQNQNNQPLQNPHQKPLWRRILRKIHLWLGLATTIPLIVIAVTGIMQKELFP